MQNTELDHAKVMLLVETMDDMKVALADLRARGRTRAAAKMVIIMEALSLLGEAVVMAADQLKAQREAEAKNVVDGLLKEVRS